MADFDERSGVVPCATAWGKWWQTIEDVNIEVDLEEGTKAKDIKCTFKAKSISVIVNGKKIIEGELSGTVHADDAIWTLEDKKLLRICLLKSDQTAGNIWKSLLIGQYEADPWTYDQMEQKMTLQRFQFENPGFDFSGAKMTGDYHGGGPKLPS